MNEENKQPEMELLSKYLAGEATPEEAMQLHESLNNGNNKEEYNKVVQLWNRLPNATPKVVTSAEEEWAKLEKKIKHPQKTIVRKLTLNSLAIAASIIGLILVISYAVFFNDNKEQVAKVTQGEKVIKASTEVITETLPDASVVTISKNSTVAYSGSFNNVNREISLNGEAYFNVVPDKTKPFIISVDKLKIKVVGTSFNVRDISAGKMIEVQVQSGIVKMFTTQEEITVVKGQTGIYDKDDGKLNLKDTIDINSISYATKTFSFSDLSFVEACRYLEKAFNVIIKIDAQKFSDCRLTAQFNNKPLEYILDIISATLNSSYKKQGNTIYIVGEGCQ